MLRIIINNISDLGHVLYYLINLNNDGLQNLSARKRNIDLNL